MALTLQKIGVLVGGQSVGLSGDCWAKLGLRHSTGCDGRDNLEIGSFCRVAKLPHLATTDSAKPTHPPCKGRCRRVGRRPLARVARRFARHAQELPLPGRHLVRHLTFLQEVDQISASDKIGALVRYKAQTVFGPLAKSCLGNANGSGGNFDRIDTVFANAPRGETPRHYSAPKLGSTRWASAQAFKSTPR